MKSLALYVVICLSGMMFGAEIVASHVTQSLALLISAYHMLYNILSLLLLVISHRMSKGKTLKNTFGWARVKVLGMMVNMLFLCALCFAGSVESVQTIVHASHENTEPRYALLILCLGIINLVLNFICFLLIGGYTHHQGCSMIIQGNDIQVNYVLMEANVGQEICPTRDKVHKDSEICSEDMTSAKVGVDHKLIDLSRDTSSCLAVIACACVVLFLDGLILKYADAILAIASIIVLLATTYPFIHESGLILLQSIPNNMDVDGLAARLRKEFPDVLNVHDLHVWRLTATEVITTVHVILSSQATYPSIASDMKEFFQKEGISYVTIQPEFFKESCSAKNGVCILACSSNNNCEALTCCGVQSRCHDMCTGVECVAPSTSNNGTINEYTPLREVEEAVGASFPISNGQELYLRKMRNCESLDLSTYDFTELPTATETKL